MYARHRFCPTKHIPGKGFVQHNQCQEQVLFSQSFIWDLVVVISKTRYIFPSKKWFPKFNNRVFNTKPQRLSPLKMWKTPEVCPLTIVLFGLPLVVVELVPLPQWLAPLPYCLEYLCVQTWVVCPCMTHPLQDHHWGGYAHLTSYNLLWTHTDSPNKDQKLAKILKMWNNV